MLIQLKTSKTTLKNFYQTSSFLLISVTGFDDIITLAEAIKAGKEPFPLSKVLSGFKKLFGVFCLNFLIIQKQKMNCEVSDQVMYNNSNSRERNYPTANELKLIQDYFISVTVEKNFYIKTRSFNQY